MKNIFVIFLLVFSFGCNAESEIESVNPSIEIKTLISCDRFEIIEQETASGILIHTTRFTDVYLPGPTTMSLEGMYIMRQGTGVDQLTTVIFEENVQEDWELPLGDYRVVCFESWKLYSHQQIQWEHEESYNEIFLTPY